MRNIPRYGSGGSSADAFGLSIAGTFTRLVKEKPTPHGFNMIPGIFSWAANIVMGRDVGATPNGRHARAPISHGPNPDPGFRKDAAPTALALAVASVQPGYGNTAPMQIELDPGLSKTKEDIEKVVNLIKTHFDLGGTQINMNILDKKAILEAHKDPSTASGSRRARHRLQRLLRQPLSRDAANRRRSHHRRRMTGNQSMNPPTGQ